jgi:hypothetical protein
MSEFEREGDREGERDRDFEAETVGVIDGSLIGEIEIEGEPDGVLREESVVRMTGELEIEGEGDR